MSRSRNNAKKEETKIKIERMLDSREARNKKLFDYVLDRNGVGDHGAFQINNIKSKPNYATFGIGFNLGDNTDVGP